MKLSAFSIKRPIFTFVSMIFVLVLGAVSLFNIPLKLIPDIDPPVAVVVTSYDGASPTEVSEKVSKPLEQSLSTLPGLKNISSTSQEGASLVLLEFSWTTKLSEVENDIMRAIDSAALSSDAGKPRFMKFDPSQFPILQMSLSSETGTEELQKMAEQLEQQLLKIEGVASVNTSGTFVEQIKVTLDEDKLVANQLSQSDIVNTIAANNISLPGEQVLTEGQELTTRIISTLQSQEDIEQLTVAVNPLTNENIKIVDVAAVETVQQDEGTITRTNNSPAVLLSILQQSDANTAALSKNIQSQLEEILQEDTYNDIKTDILFDQGDFIRLSISNISNSLIIGALLAMVVLFFFLRSLKSPIIVGIAIPYSVIVTFVLMYFSDFSLNVMTLGGLALGVGMLVDNSIVVIENIYRHLSMGKDPKTAAREGAGEVGSAIIASTLTTVVVFLPIAFISGIIGDLFKEFALTISFSLFASLFVALSVVPMLASRWLKKLPDDVEEKRKKSTSMRFLRRSVQWALLHRWAVLLITLILVVVSGYGMTKVGTEFLPSADEGYFTIKVELENGTALSETEKVVSAIEQQLQNVDEVDVYVSFIGSTQQNSFGGSAQGNRAEITVNLKDLSERERSVFEVADDLKAEVEQVAIEQNESAEVTFSLQSSQGNSPNTLTFNVRDSDKQRLLSSVETLEKDLSAIDNISQVQTDISDTVKEINIVVNREEALKHGFMPAQIASTVNDVTRGSFATQIVTDNDEVMSVIVQYDEDVVGNIEQLKQLMLRKNDGTFVPLEQVASFETEDSPTKIQRINNQDAVQFTLQYQSNTNLGDITDEVEKIAEEVLPAETQLQYSGDRELLNTAINQMTLAFLLAVLFVYLVMAAQFESLKYPFVIMFTVPLFVIGTGIALTVTNTPIGITALIGFIVLAGIVVNNAIVLVDYINQRKRQGETTYEAIVSSVVDRARPIFMTALTTILGLVPLALGIGEGTEFNQPMGITVIGGLISSTFLTLYIIPVIYSFFEKETRKKNKIRRAINRDSVLEEIDDERTDTLNELRTIVHEEKGQGG
ncbi:MAG: efflux RND transporter permease subunit [Bacillus sp. (in: firmicutes)]